jgi:hypothetical protein
MIRALPAHSHGPQRRRGTEKRLKLCVSVSLWLVIAGALAASPSALAQNKPDFSGVWIYDQAQSGRGTAGNNPVVPFPTELHIKQTPSELHWEAHTVRQDSLTAVFSLDGREAAITGNAEMTMKGKAVLEGDRLVITSTRSYSSPAGDVVTDFKEVYSRAGNTMTVEKTQSTGGVSSTLKAVYTRSSS